MPRSIEEVLSYRTDMSTFLVHLTRDTEEKSAKEVLMQIMSDWALKRGQPLGPAAPRLRAANLPDLDQRVVCFTETPMEHVKLLTEEIVGRGCQFSQYGVAITRKQGRRSGVNPIWYLDQTPGQTARWLCQDIERLVDAAIANPTIQGLERILHIAPFIEQMGTWTDRRKEFWWEREWRIVGNLPLPGRIIVLCPEQDFDEVMTHADSINRLGNCQLIDPCWSLERMIAHLSGFQPADVGSP